MTSTPYDPGEEDMAALVSPDVTAQSAASAGSVRAGKWTPGPWVYRPEAPYDWGWVTNAVGGFIAQAKDPRACDERTLMAHRAAKTDPWVANARLIAAAPEMFDAASRVIAAKEAVDAWVALGFPSRNLVPQPDHKAAMVAFTDLRAALAKAVAS